MSEISNHQKPFLIRALGVLRSIFGRAIFLYILVAAITLHFANLTRAWNHIVPTILSRYMPSYDYMFDFEKDRHHVDIAKLKEFERYYKKVTELMPKMADAEGMLGFCYFYGGEQQKAARAYERAIKIHPQCFSFHYNLGYIELKQRHYPQAFNHFKNSIQVEPIDNIKFIIGSRIYLPLLPARQQPNVLAQIMGEHVGQGYRQAYLDLLWTCEQMKDYKNMLFFSQKAIATDIDNQGPFYYYAGLAAYELKDYPKSIVYFQEALTRKFNYSQTFYTLGLALRAVNRPESIVAMRTAEKLSKEGKIFNGEQDDKELVLY